MKIGSETDRWPRVQARWFGLVPPGRPRTVRLIVWHDMEYDETLTAAEDVAHYFATTDRQASAHVCIDADSVVQCVPDSDVAYAAPGCNADGIHLELAGRARQTREEWLDDYGRRLLDRACEVAAQYCVKYDIPPVHLTDAELAAGAKGMVGHAQCSAVYKKSDHTDPGPNFPWDLVVAGTLAHYHLRLNSGGLA